MDYLKSLKKYLTMERSCKLLSENKQEGHFSTEHKHSSGVSLETDHYLVNLYIEQHDKQQKASSKKLQNTDPRTKNQEI